MPLNSFLKSTLIKKRYFYTRVPYLKFFLVKKNLKTITNKKAAEIAQKNEEEFCYNNICGKISFAFDTEQNKQSQNQMAAWNRY